MGTLDITGVFDLSQLVTICGDSVDLMGHPTMYKRLQYIEVNMDVMPNVFVHNVHNSKERLNMSRDRLEKMLKTIGEKVEVMGIDMNSGRYRYRIFLGNQND